MRLTLLEILEATGGGEIGGTQVGERFATYHTDSREVKPGGIFFALRGAEMDGHRFVADAISHGASAVVVEHRTEIPSGIVANIGAVHMEFFETQDDLARAKGELVAGLPSDGRAVLNSDDRFLDLLSSLSSAPVTTFGTGVGDYRVSDYRALPEGGCTFKVNSVDVEVAVGGRHQALNAAAALAAGEEAGVTLVQGAPALSSVAVEHRLQTFDAPAGFTVIDDAYNASPESMLAAFAAVSERPHEGKLLAVLGHMGELGRSADDAHVQIGEVAGKTFDEVAVVDS